MAERKEVVGYCISHNRYYKETASIYDVSYSHVYFWVKKYDVAGEDGLTDQRGRHKRDNEIDEMERLQRENLRLKRQLEEKEYQMYKITDEAFLRYAIKDCLKFYSEERLQDRYGCQTPLEVKTEGGGIKRPQGVFHRREQTNKKYKEKWCA